MLYVFPRRQLLVLQPRFLHLTRRPPRAGAAVDGRETSSLMRHDLFRIFLLILWVGDYLRHARGIELSNGLCISSLRLSSPCLDTCCPYALKAQGKRRTLRIELSEISSFGRSCSLTILPSASDDHISRVVCIVMLLAALGRGALNVNVCLKSTAISSDWTFSREPVRVVLGVRERTVYDSVEVDERTMGRLTSCPAGN